MSTINVAAVLAELLPIASNLFTVIEKIRADSPDAWAYAEQNYADAVAAWQATKNALTISATVTPQASALIENEISTAPDNTGKSAAEQIGEHPPAWIP